MDKIITSIKEPRQRKKFKWEKETIFSNYEAQILKLYEYPDDISLT